MRGCSGGGACMVAPGEGGACVVAHYTHFAGPREGNGPLAAFNQSHLVVQEKKNM